MSLELSSVMMGVKRRQRASRVAMRLSLERFVFQRADMVIHMESNIIQSVMASSAWHCGVKEPIMLDIVVN